MISKRFKLWRTLETYRCTSLDDVTDEWGVIDTSINCDDMDDVEDYEGVDLSSKNLFVEEEVIDILNKQDSDIKSMQDNIIRLNKYIQSCYDRIYDLKEENERLRFDFTQMKELFHCFEEENKEFKELLRLIADIDTIQKSDNVKDLIKIYAIGLDAVSDKYTTAYNDYVLLCNFFKQYYGEDLK